MYHINCPLTDPRCTSQKASSLAYSQTANSPNILASGHRRSESVSALFPRYFTWFHSTALTNLPGLHHTSHGHFTWGAETCRCHGTTTTAAEGRASWRRRSGLAAAVTARARTATSCRPRPAPCACGQDAPAQHKPFQFHHHSPIGSQHDQCQELKSKQTSMSSPFTSLWTWVAWSSSAVP